MFVSDFLSRFSSANENEEPILKNSSLDTSSYMTKIDDLCQYDYITNICSHSFPLTRSVSTLKQVAIPNLFQPDTSRPARKASILRDPPAVMAGKRSTIVPSVVPPEHVTAKMGHGHPRKVWTHTTTATIQESNVEQDLDLNDTLPTLYQIRHKVRHPTLVPLPVIGPPPTPLYNEDETALKNIHVQNLQDNMDLTRCTAAPRPPNDLLQTVTEVVQPAVMETHFPRLHPLKPPIVKTFNSKLVGTSHTKRSSIKLLTN